MKNASLKRQDAKVLDTMLIYHFVLQLPLSDVASFKFKLETPGMSPVLARRILSQVVSD